MALNNAAQNVVKKQIKVAAVKSIKPIVSESTRTIKQSTIAQVNKKTNNTYSKKSIYAVQVASFSKLANAEALVNKLHSKGYKASFIKTSGRQGSIYKVYAGHSPVKSDVMKLKVQLASSMQLNGFVVNTGVS